MLDFLSREMFAKNNMKNKLRWLLVAVILFDFAVTILGQPSSYWHDPLSADEGNALFRWFMVRGTICYFAFILSYIVGIFVLVTALPRKSALITGLIFLLAHYFAASTWLSYHFRLSMAGPIMYAVVLSMALMWILESGGSKGCFLPMADCGER
jgi:hypothetical protein